jgi:hypothetical protein
MIAVIYGIANYQPWLFQIFEQVMDARFTKLTLRSYVGDGINAVA